MSETSTQPGTTRPAAYTPTDRTVPTRSKERAAYDHELVHASTPTRGTSATSASSGTAPRRAPHPLRTGSASASTYTARRVRARCG